MKTLLPIISSSALVLWLCGCSTSEEKIYFASAATIPAPPKDSLVSHKTGLDKADEKKIQFVVYEYMLDRHFWDDGNYSAIFVQADDEVVDQLILKYPHHVPPIKQSWHIDLRSSQSPLDRDTGQPVMILGADVGEPNADASVDVIGRWYAGSAVQGHYTFSVKKSGEAWTVVSVK